MVQLIKAGDLTLTTDKGRGREEQIGYNLLVQRTVIRWYNLISRGDEHLNMRQEIKE